VRNKQFFVKDIVRILPDCEIIGNTDKFFTNIKNINEADEYSLIWIKSGYKNCRQIINNTKASFILCDDSVEIPDKILENKCVIIVNNPRLSIAKIISGLFVKESKFGIDNTAIIHKSAKLHSNIFIGPHTYIGEAEIEEGTIIYGNVYIYDNVKVGKNCIVHAGAVIGSDGFGFEKDEKGTWLKIPHIGGVIISDDVEIGANTCIDRGTLENTFISNGVKIDNLCHIGHNVTIGENSILTSGVVIGGSTKIGRNCWISPNSTIINGIYIEDSVFIGIGSVVVGKIKSNSRVFGNPAIKIAGNNK